MPVTEEKLRGVGGQEWWGGAEVPLKEMSFEIANVHVKMSRNVCLGEFEA